MTTSSTVIADRHRQRIAAKVDPCVPAVMPLRGFRGRQTGADGKPPPSALASAMMSGVTPLCS